MFAAPLLADRVTAGGLLMDRARHRLRAPSTNASVRRASARPLPTAGARPTWRVATPHRQRLDELVEAFSRIGVSPRGVTTYLDPGVRIGPGRSDLRLLQHRPGVRGAGGHLGGRWRRLPPLHRSRVIA
jgi:hypothetical protein